MPIWRSVVAEQFGLVPCGSLSLHSENWSLTEKSVEEALILFLGSMDFRKNLRLGQAEKFSVHQEEIF